MKTKPVITIDNEVRDILTQKAGHDCSTGRCQIIDMAYLIDGMDEEKLFYIVTTEDFYYGASCILNPEAIEALEDLYQMDFYVLPSSVHEVITAPSCLYDDLDALRSIVESVNLSMLPEDQRIGDFVMRYDYERRHLGLITDKMEPEVYTMDRWHEDGDFSAAAGQEITKEVYEDMFNVMPPLQLPPEKAQQANHDFHIPVHAGFLMGEATSADKDGLLYHAFSSNNYGHGSKYYYLGLSHHEKLLHGSYYFFDCLGVLGDPRANNIFRTEDFRDDAEAIAIAVDHEATLYRYEYDYGHLTSSKVLTEPKYY